MYIYISFRGDDFFSRSEVEKRAGAAFSGTNKK